MEAIHSPSGSVDARKYKYGDLPSLHHSLDNNVLARLEEALLCCCLRDFEPAIAIFAAFPPGLRRHPVIAYYHSQAYWLQWLQYKCVDVLQDALTASDQFNSQFHDSGIYTLLRVFLGTVKYHVDGNFILAREALREIKDWLSHVPIQDYTDIQTQCIVRHYYILLITNNVTTNFDSEFFQSIPSGGRKTPTRLTELREYLQSGQRLIEARSVLDVELGFCASTMDQESACNSFLDACHSCTAHEPIWWIAGRARLRLAHVMHVGENFEEAHRQLKRAKENLNIARVQGRSNKAELYARLLELKVCSRVVDAGLFIDDADLFERYRVFANDPDVQKDFYIYSTALSRGLDIALAIVEKNPNLDNVNKFWKWSARNEALLEEIGDIANMYINRLATGDIACSHLGDFAAIIKWHKDFDAKYPKLNLWRSRINAKKTLVLIHHGIKNEYEALKHVIAIKNLSTDQDVFWSEEGFRPQVEVSSNNALRTIDQQLLPVAFQTGFGQIDWLLDFSKSLPVQTLHSWEMLRIKVGSDERIISFEMEELLLTYMKEDFAIGLLSQTDLEILYSGLLSTDDDHDLRASIDHSRFLEDMSPESLSSMLYGTASSPTPDKQWERTYETLSVWLLNKSARPENKRHFLLFQIQDFRQAKCLSGNCSYETKAAECQRLIDLIPRLNKPVQEQVSSNVSSWRSLVASAKYCIYLQKHGQPFLDTESPEFAEILHLYGQCLQENRGNGRLIREVYTSVNIAQLYFHAALKLNQSAVDPLFQSLGKALNTLEKIRDGWRALQGWERVQNLTLALADPMIMSIVPWAVAVLCKFPDTHREMRSNLIWTMIQVAKSIGLGWLMEINAGIALEANTKTGASIPSEIQEEQTGVDCGTSSRSAEISEDGLKSEQGKDPLGADAEFQHLVDHETCSEDLRDHSAAVSEREDTAKETEKQDSSDETSDKTFEEMLSKLHRLSNLGGNAVFVDWYNGTSRLQSFSKPLMVTISPGENPKCCIVDITWSTIDSLIEEFIHLDTSDLKKRKNYKLLYKLNPLIEPLKALTKPGQVLVFSPCGHLHRIPLHALKIDGDVLIRRNPIVYCSSLSALIVAFESREDTKKSAPTSHDSCPQIKAAVYGDPPSEVGIKALNATAFNFGVEPHIGDNFKSVQFIKTIQDPGLQLLHYHGHAHFSQTSPMDQSFQFNDRHLTLRNIFDIVPGHRAFHATLLGCGSGASKTALTNDVIGLVPSLFHAGAASTVSTLWPFSDQDAALYSKYFYEEVYGECGDGKGVGEQLETGVERMKLRDGADHRKSGGTEFWNLAKANQRAVLKIREQKSELYHWAAFVLNGWWMMRV